MKILNKNLIILILVLIPTFIFAQSREEIDILVSPSSPKPNQEVSLSLISNTPGLENSTIIWRKNGIVENQGKGQINHTTTVGDLGENTAITVSITKASGAFLTDRVDIRPADVYLIWEADSYTPVFYRGKGLPGHQTSVRVIAIPYFLNTSKARIDSDDLNYEWSIDGKIDRDQSGVGKDVFNLKGSLISRPKRVSVFVSSQGGSITARKTTTVNFTDPEIIIYKENPLTGIKNSQSLKEGLVTGNESTFIAEPYYFPETFFNNETLNYKWEVDGVELENSEKRRGVTFSGDVAGRSSVFVEIWSPFNLLQRTSSLFSVTVNTND